MISSSHTCDERVHHDGSVVSAAIHVIVYVTAADVTHVDGVVSS